MSKHEQFDRIYDETRDEMLRFVMLRTGAASEAEDLFQEVYCRFYQRLTRGLLPILDPKRYLYSIAKNTLSRYYRKAAVRRSTEQPIPEETDVPSFDEPIDEQLLRTERKEAVWQILSQEPELNRRAFLLFYGYDRSQAEISKALGISEEAVRQRLYRTRLRVRAMLEAEPNER